ncbi:hypothetical protein [Actinoplanes sp. NPDC049599]|uniref:hypothetical protein n=1 Tax=Actinoplanes sp. NPDC049599 TaxID=3363903 RepID=UPI0037BD500C
MPSRLPRLLAATGLAVSVLTLATACSQTSSQDKNGAAPATAPGSTAQFGDGPAPDATGTPAATATKAPKPAAVLDDGRWPGFVKDTGAGTVSMDLVEFLTGDAAAKAWQKKYPDSEQDTPDNDYFIVNDNTKVRKLTLASAVEVKVVGDDGPEADTTLAAADLGKHFGDQLGSTLFWFTVKQGKVTKIEQQFLP